MSTNLFDEEKKVVPVVSTTYDNEDPSDSSDNETSIEVIKALVSEGETASLQTSSISTY